MSKSSNEKKLKVYPASFLPLSNPEEVVAFTSSATEILVLSGYFVLMDDEKSGVNKPPRMVSLSSPSGDGLSVMIWEKGNDGIYRECVDVNITNDFKFIIEQRMETGEYRRTDLKIIY